MSLRFFSAQLTTLQRRGVRADEAMSVIGLDPESHPHPAKRIPLEAVEQIYKAAAEQLGDPFIALRNGYEFRVPRFAQTGAIFVYCQNITQVLEMNRKYQKLAVDAARLSHEIEDGKHIFVLTPYEQPCPHPHVLLMIMGAYASTFQWLNWTIGQQIKAAHFNFPTPDDIQLFHDIFRCPLRFNQPKLGLEFFAESMETPLPTADPEKFAYAVSKLEAILQSQNTSETFIKAARSSIAAALELGSVSLSGVAARLSLTDRQLRQKLKNSGASYRGLLERERKAAFERLFENGVSFAEISQSLGYNDQAAFNRAFKRWHGMSPSAYKKLYTVDAGKAHKGSKHAF